MARTTAIISLSIPVTSIEEIVLFQEGGRTFVCRAPFEKREIMLFIGKPKGRSRMISNTEHRLRTPFAFVITQWPQIDKAIRVSSRDKDSRVEVFTAYHHGQYAVWAHLLDNHDRAHSLQDWRSSALNLKDRHPGTSMPSARQRSRPHRS